MPSSYHQKANHSGGTHLESQSILKIENVTKSFPGVVALDDVSFDIKAGEVHGIVGENGAGKSTLIKSIMGIYKVDKGRIVIYRGGNWVQPKNAIDAKGLGMYANYQDVNIANTLRVSENYFLGHLPTNKLGLVNWKKVHTDTKQILKKFHLEEIDPNTRIERLPIALKEMVTISKISLLNNLNLVIFDEPTAFFENEKIEELFRYIQELKARGITIIYISHRLEEIIRICDRVTILKDGQYVATKDVAEINNDVLISMMVGRTIKDIYDIQHREPGEEALRVENLSAKGKFKDVGFSISKGEILGFFGLTGSGRSDIMKAIYGAERLDGGKIFVKDKPANIKNPITAMRAGIGLVPEDRIREGVAPGLSVKININLNSYDMITKLGFINLKKEIERAAHFIKAIRIQTPSQSQKVLNISGGNQQKIVISKLLCRNLDVYIFDEPTVGVDIGAKDEIYRLIGQLTAEGKAVILVSSYLPEVMGLSDRLIVIADGEKVGEIKRGDKKLWNEEEILKIASKQKIKD